MAGEAGSEGSPLGDEWKINDIGPVGSGKILTGVYEPKYFDAKHEQKKVWDKRGFWEYQPIRTTIAPSKGNEGANISSQPGQPGVEATVTYNQSSKKSAVTLKPVSLGLKGAYQLDLEQRRLVEIPPAGGSVEISGRLLAFPIVNQGVGFMPISWLVDEGKKEVVKEILGPVFNSLVAGNNEAIAAAARLATR
jgi:hypothetical protein